MRKALQQLIVLALYFLCPVALNLTAAPGGKLITLDANPANGTVLSALISSLNAALAQAWGGFTAVPAKGSMLVSGLAPAGALSFVFLSGAWVGDEPLLVPPQTVFVLGGFTLTASASLENDAPLILANRSAYSAVVAPLGDAALLCQGENVRGVLALQSAFFTLSGLRLEDCGGRNTSTCSSAVHIKGAPFVSGAQVFNNRILGGCRAIWMQTCSRVFIHSNVIINASKHTIDFDSYAKDSVVWNNSVSFSAQEAVFLEQGASAIVVVGNVLGPGNWVGLAVFNFDFPLATQNHFVVGNLIFGSLRYGIAVGSFLPTNASQKTASVNIWSNTLRNNSVGIHANGGQTSTLYFSNDDTQGFYYTALALKGDSAVAFDPLGTARTMAPLTSSATPSRTSSASFTPSPGYAASLMASLTASATPSPTSSASFTPSPGYSAPVMPSLPGGGGGTAAAGAAAQPCLTHAPTAALFAGVGFAVGLGMGCLLARRAASPRALSTSLPPSALRKPQRARVSAFLPIR